MDVLSGVSVASTQQQQAVVNSGGVGGAAAKAFESVQLLPSLIRYAKRIEVKVKALNTRQDPKKAGRIYPPIVKIEYGEISLDDLQAGKTFDFIFKVDYDMEVWETEKDIEVRITW